MTVHVMQAVDRFNNLVVTAFVTPGCARFLLLHDGRNDDAIKNFFTDVYEVYLKVSMHNVLYQNMAMFVVNTHAVQMLHVIDRVVVLSHVGHNNLHCILSTAVHLSHVVPLLLPKCVFLPLRLIKCCVLPCRSC